MGTRRLTMDGTLGDTADEERNTSDSETVIGGEVWDLARRLVVSPFPLALISSGVLFGLLLLAAVFAVLRLYCAGYENSTPRSSLASTDLDSVEWGCPQVDSSGSEPRTRRALKRERVLGTQIPFRPRSKKQKSILSSQSLPPGQLRQSRVSLTRESGPEISVCWSPIVATIFEQQQ